MNNTNIPSYVININSDDEPNPPHLPPRNTQLPMSPSQSPSQLPSPPSDPPPNPLSDPLLFLPTNVPPPLHPPLHSTSYYVPAPPLPPLPPLPPPPNTLYNSSHDINLVNSQIYELSSSSNSLRINNDIDTHIHNHRDDGNEYDDRDDRDDYDDRDDDSLIDSDSDTEFIFEDDAASDNRCKYNNLYDYCNNINDMNNYKNNSNKYFITTITSLNKELQVLYKDNLKLTNNNFYLKNKNTISLNTIHNYKDIIKSNKDYMYELYTTNKNLLHTYGQNIINLKIIIQNQNIIINEFKDSLKCSICYDNNINILFYPCNHTIMCNICYEEFNKYDNKCPLCKKRILSSSKIYLPQFK